ncbi:MAG: hypothetical protein PVH68_13800, partial [Armatimonadota bacterium]
GYVRIGNSEGAFSRIPHEHLPFLDRDFDFVIVGIHLLLQLIKLLQPRLVKELKPRFDLIGGAMPNLLDRSADRLVHCVFRKRWDQIAEHASPAIPGRPPDPVGQPQSVRVTPIKAPGTPLFGFARKLGEAVKLEELRDILADPHEPFRFALAPFGLKLFSVDVAQALAKWVARKAVSSIRGGQLGERALVRFLCELLTARRPRLHRALRDFRSRLRPIIEPYTTDVEEAVRRGEYGVRITPACWLACSKSCRAKALDLEKLIFRVNGYDVRELPDYFKYCRRWVGDIPERELEVKVKYTGPRGGTRKGAIRQDAAQQDKGEEVAMPTGVHHLFVDIFDKSDVHAEHLDQEITIRPPSLPSGEERQEAAAPGQSP